MNRDRLKKLIYDLDITNEDLNKSIKLLTKYYDIPEMKDEIANSLKYNNIK